MDEKNELNDIILNKGGSASDFSKIKKIVLAVATLFAILIIVVMLMSTLTPDAKDNLPQPIPLPTQEAALNNAAQEEPLFEEVEVIEENSQSSSDLDAVAQKLKQESLQETKKVKKTKVQVKKHEPKKVVQKKVVKKTVAPKKVVQKKVVQKKKATHTAKQTTAKSYYIQVGSFSKYKPNKNFLDSILNLGYKYKYHKVTRNSKVLNKVLVGPFYTEKEARSALRTIRSKIEAGAFLIKL
jgi:DedD protein